MAVTHHGEQFRSTPAKARRFRMSMLTDTDYQRAYRYAIALCGDRDMAYDVVHNAAANWLQAAPRNVVEPLGYFLRIVRNCFLADAKRAAMLRWTPLDEVAGVIATDMAPLEETFLQRVQLQRIWIDLRAAEREVLFLWAVEGFTIEEIAQQTATPKGTLLTRLHRLRKRFAETDSRRTAGEIG